MAEEVVLLDFWPSAFGLRVRIALAEKGVEYQHKEEDLANKSPLLLKSNPVHNQIPVLIHKGRKPVSESLVIVQYIDEAWKEPTPLLPKDPYQCSIARFWADSVDKKILECGSRVWKNKGDAKMAAAKELIQHLKLFEGELGDKPYFGGETFGYVDIALVSFASWLYCYEKCGHFSIEEECPKLKAWEKRCMKRESVSSNMQEHERVYEYVCFLKKKLGIE